MYDYGRKDKNGNERELHIDKALKVTDLKKFLPTTFDGCLGKSEYFTVNKHVISGSLDFFADADSFNAVTCIVGSGTIDGKEIKQGDSFFVPAGFGKYTVFGDLEIILTKV